MSAHDPLPLLLRGLNLPHVAKEHAAALARAEAENWGYRRFLLHLVEGEANERLRRRIERQVKESGLPGGKTLGTLDEARLPEKVRRQLPTLLDCELVRRGDNLLCFGLPGRGKSHFAAAMGREWIQRHQLKVLFVPTFKLVGQLLVAKRDLKLPGMTRSSSTTSATCSSRARRWRCSSPSWPSATRSGPWSSPLRLPPFGGQGARQTRKGTRYRATDQTSLHRRV
jgi:DNA replication protein DnaC